MGNRLFKLFLLIPLLALVFSACSSVKPQDFAEKSPVFRPEEYFVGVRKGHGVFFDRFRKLRRSFTVDLNGTWDGKTLALDEKLLFDDGEKLSRVYMITKINDNMYEVTNSDLVGKATIEAYGNTLKWTYRLRQDMGEGSIWVLSFDDWMYLQPNEVVLNRAFAKKWGFELGEIFMSVR